ncbi:carboxynorspermidine decarboxylase [Syntrophobotulus glycolicus DSM 8271]|uniref:Carboxynorspermidine decarboxylase n=1 Tax=Syntrophobotulus glycolicus (strain DSM 8271 / FlGlyR) TaxID=645991 RepID=F0T1M0_SYNGF|nr:carboxynorspermidine decarboxylase [Syntrophobotulus glycolicus]ADY57444.1 carboxynorspermidine decarboxylase [Syntrophobotulus glycolicus DSM 8271]
MNQEFALVPTPSYVIEEKLLVKNLEILKSVQERSGARILLAQKAFSMFRVYPLLARYLCGTTASGLYEARLGREEFGKEVHIFSPAYRDDEFEEILAVADHIVFNSFAQWEKFGRRTLAAGKKCGLRINPECSTQNGPDLYNPCAPHSRLGVTKANFQPDKLAGISGLHLHTLCQQNADALAETLKAFEAGFGEYLYDLEWLNLGGGHHITREDYDLDLLVRTISRLRQTYDLTVYLEPGEAVALDSGFLVSSVLDILDNGMNIAILDTSAACHMPDVLEMPYRPEIIGAGQPGEKKYTYRLGGPTCLAGDIIGDYSFDRPLFPGDRLVFCDMAIYSMVKNNTFNGMRLPDIILRTAGGTDEIIRSFGYTDFKDRLS